MRARNMNIKGNSGEGSERKKERQRQSFHFPREYINNHEQNVGRKMDAKVHFSEISGEMMNMLLDYGEKAILVIMWQRTWLNCVLVFLEGRT